MGRTASVCVRTRIDGADSEFAECTRGSGVSICEKQHVDNGSQA